MAYIDGSGGFENTRTQFYNSAIHTNLRTQQDEHHGETHNVEIGKKLGQIV